MATLITPGLPTQAIKDGENHRPLTAGDRVPVDGDEVRIPGGLAVGLIDSICFDFGTTRHNICVIGTTRHNICVIGTTRHNICVNGRALNADLTGFEAKHGRKCRALEIEYVTRADGGPVTVDITKTEQGTEAGKQ